MPTLPTLTVTQAQADRMLAAYGGPGATQAQAVNAYKQWLANQIIEYVKQQEWKNRVSQIQAEKSALDSSAATDLMPAELIPPA